MTTNKKIIYIDLATEDIPTFYWLNKKNKLVEQIMNQLTSEKIK